MAINNIQAVVYNWRQVDGGEDYDLYEVGKKQVQRIDYDENLKCCKVSFKDGACSLLFNINTIKYMTN